MGSLPFGIAGHWKGEPAQAELPQAVYRIAPDGKLHQVITDLAGPNGLAFSPDESVLYVVESRAAPHRKIWAHDHQQGRLANKRLAVDAAGAGAIDGFRVDIAGNLWCGWGSDGRLDAALPAHRSIDPRSPHYGRRIRTRHRPPLERQ